MMSNNVHDYIHHRFFLLNYAELKFIDMPLDILTSKLDTVCFGVTNHPEM